MLTFSDIFAAFRWWAALMVLGTAVTPLTFTLFRKLPDRGYAFTKMVGLLLVSYLFWLLSSIGLLDNNLGGILVSVGLVTAVSKWVYSLQRNKETERESLLEWLRSHRGQVILTEAVFLLIFVLWVWVRAHNPSILNTEKPMDFAFLNGIGRSPTMPPLDPWLSGFAISYYYFGYVMTSVLARLTAVPTTIAFNLSLAWLIAGTATGAFGLIYNLIIGINRKDTKTAEKETTTPNRSLAIAFGLLAAIALPLAGNQEITLEILNANRVGSNAFWQWLDVRNLEELPPQPDPALSSTEIPRYETGVWWWWRSSRVINEHHLSGRLEEGLEPIAEFPAFSFGLGDMHPHVLALPFAFLSLAVAYLWFLESGNLRLTTDDLRLANLKSSIVNRQSSILWFFTVLVLGGLSFLNTWDILPHLFMVLGAYVLARRRQEGWHKGLWSQAFLLAVSLVMGAVLAYLPFFLGFKSQAGAPYLLPMLMRPTRLVHFLVIFIMPLSSIVLLLLALAVRRRFRGWQMGVGTVVSLLIALLLLMFLLSWVIASSPDGAGRVTGLANELGVPLTARPATAVAFGWGLRAVFALLPVILAARLTYPALTLFLLAIVALVVMLWQKEQGSKGAGEQGNDSSPLPFVLLLILTGVLLTLGPEFVYLRDNFGMRLNTIFKFYYQAWVLFGVAGLFAIAYMWQHFRKGLGAIVPGLATAVYLSFFAISLLFPYYMARSRAIEYGGPLTAENRPALTLDGLDFLVRSQPAEYAAITWLRDNVGGTPVILEAVGGQYSDYGRIAASTGLPTVLGWAGHEYQWRGSTPEPSEREEAIRQIYSNPDWEITTELLNRYNVAYIVVGPRELYTYGSLTAEKFNPLPIAYRLGDVTIYQWK
ncbi:MAG: hypothetical protein H6662_10740 [Ardenticatenaceae bacterium]|nr:hypothetical protein [Anaerolineales bacterium]MCB8922052.1 hypothetical protein [Ardenticatenaceae bacterium]